MERTLTTLVLGALLFLASSKVGFAYDLWNELKSGNHLVLIRHALAPGFGDPKNFDVKDCNTQRNLNNEGRRQSKKIGDLFRTNGISNVVSYSSQWCRCLDTARLLDLGKVFELPALNSFFKNFEREPLQSEEMRRWIKMAPLDTPTILISHQVNIAALTGYSAASGEIIFVQRKRDGSLSVIGSIQTL